MVGIKLLIGKKNYSQERTLIHIKDEQTKDYLKQIVLIHAKRMEMEGVLYWWTDEVLLVIFAGLAKNKFVCLPEKSMLQVREIARFCHEVCKEEKFKCNVFGLLPGWTKIHEYEEAMRKSSLRLLV